MSSALCDLSARRVVEGLKAGDFTAAQVLESTLERIASVDGHSGTLDGSSELEPDRLHAYITVTTERARNQAEAIDRLLAAGEDPGPLAGVPLAVKDIFCVAGTPSTAASRILANFISPYSATPVERLEAAGCVTVGKVNLDEFTYGSSNESSAFQPTPRNPWSTERVPGGSSGGSAVAVASGEATLSLGTDTSGSIRQPSAFCGVVGLKPTYGRVSRYGLIAFASSLDCPGPIAREVGDAALMLSVMAGRDPMDSTTARLATPDYLEQLEHGVRGLRIGISSEFARIRFPDPSTGELREQGIQPEVHEALMRTAKLLSEQGAEIVEPVSLPNAGYGIPAYFVISRVEAASNLHRYDGVKYGYRHPGPVRELAELYRKTRGEGFGLQPKLRILMGMYVSGAQYEQRYYERALKVRTLIRQDFLAAFEKVDALLAPTTPTTAFHLNQLYGDSVSMQYADLLTVPANHAGVPALSIPVGLDQAGLPIGVQLIGPDFSEHNLLRIGRAVELATAEEAWRAARPSGLAGLVDG